jgi:hypothetical protein
MSKSRLLLPFFCLILTTTVFGQLNLKLQIMPDGVTWGVYVRPESSLILSNSTVTGTGQITLVAPLNFSYSNLVNHGGNWSQNATATSPAENPGRKYITFGFLMDNPPIAYLPGEETLLFTFKRTGDCPDTLYLIDNENDPFAHLPNSLSTNPGNDLSVVDFGSSELGLFFYTGNYDLCAWNCVSGLNGCSEVQDTTGNPQDTTIINPQDTTGNPQDTTINNPPDTTGNGGGNPTSVFENGKHSRCFTLAPNPAYDWLTVRFLPTGMRENGLIRLWNSIGAPIGKLEKTANPELSMNISGLPPGIYFLTFEADGKVLQRERFMKQ